MTKRLNVAVRLTGGLGDVLLASPFLEQLHSVLEGPRIAVFYHTPAVAQFVFGGSRFVHVFGTHVDLQKPKGLSGYDLLVHTGHFPRYQVLNQRTVNFAPKAFLDALKLSNHRCAEIAGLISHHPKLDGFWGRMQAKQGKSYLDGVGWLSGLPVSASSHPVLNLDPNARPKAQPPKYITLHDGFDGRQLPKAGMATKCWPLRNWAALVQELKTTLPDFRIVQLGAGKSRRIPGVDYCLVDSTSLAEAAWFLKEAALHIDTDSGLAHLARTLHTPAVVMFGPTNAQYFGHRENSNLLPSLCGDCWWSTPDWLSKCPRGLVEPECMSSISVSSVMQAVQGHYERAWEQMTATKLTASPLRLYDGMVRAAQVVADSVAEAADLTPGPITSHLVDPQTGIYVHASKQWEYAYVAAEVAQHWRYGTPLRVADVGGGRGALACYLAKHGAQVTQFDRDYEWGRGAASEAEYQAWAKLHNYEARFGSIYNLPAGSAEYDVVLCISVLEHLPEKTAALRELLRILKPGGILVLTFDLAVEPEKFRDKLRVDVASPDSLRTWLDSVGVTMPGVSDVDVRQSIQQIHADSVAGIPGGMTVAGLVISKSKAVREPENGEARIAALLAELSPEERDAALALRRSVGAL